MKKLIQRLKYGLPRKLKDIWWHRAIWISDHRFPIIKWEGYGYVDCRVGVIMPMFELKDGKYAYYEVTEVTSKTGGDYVYDGDRDSCDMKFAFIDSQLLIIVKGTQKIS